MKKVFILFLFIACFTAAVNAQIGHFYLNLSNGLGLGRLFCAETFQKSEQNQKYIYENRNYDGYGFQAGFTYNFNKKTLFSVGWGINSGNSKEESWPEGLEGNKIRTTYYFRFWSLHFRAGYIALSLKNGLEFVPFAGFTYNKIQKNDKPLFQKKSFTGIEAGLRINYKIIDRWGWHLEAAYNSFFNSEGFKRLRIGTGISFNL